jgi:hypothetical protein
MRLLTGWVVSAGLVFTVAAANAQMPAPYGIGAGPATLVSDIEGPGPYAAMPPEAPVPGYDYGPRLLPSIEVYTIVRENGFSPLGIPRQRGLVYTISVIDRGGNDGRLVIDARTGRIIRFMPAYRMGDNFSDDPPVIYGSAGPRPPASAVRWPPRPPLGIPRVASRTAPVPAPKPAPRAVAEPKPAAPVAVAPAPAPAQQSAAAQPAPAAAAPAAPAPVEAKPPVQIQPTQEMPKAQGLD